MRIILSIIMIYISICSMLFIFQRKLQYVPSGTLENLSYYNLDGFVKETLTTKDGITLTAWFKAPLKQEKILVYFHGNAGNLGGRAEKFDVFSKNSNYGIFAISYRGYPGSTGKPTEKGLLQDALAATDFLESKGYSAKDFILYGESLGTGLAIQHALKIKPFGLVLESPYSSIANVARKSYWYAPIDLLLKDRFDSIKYIPEIETPVIIFHGNKDSVVPYQEGKIVFEGFNSRKKLITFSNAGHLDFDEKLLIKEIDVFFKNREN